MGVIALITVPIIKDTIESAREKNFKNSALGLIEAANEYYLNSKLTGDYFEEIEFKVNNGKMISGNKELSFNGKVPVGDSYVKIKANGDVAINITDGEFYAVKDYDEIGASIGTSEDTALLREELAKKIDELEKKVENNKSELDNKIDSNKTELAGRIESNTTNINNNKSELETKINNNKSELQSNIDSLTDKNVNSNIFLKTYPVGSIYVSTSNIDPTEIYGGTWELNREFNDVISAGSQVIYDLVSEKGIVSKTQILTAYGYNLIDNPYQLVIPSGYHAEYSLSFQLTSTDAVKVSVFLNNIQTDEKQTWSQDAFRVLTSSKRFKKSDIVLEKANSATTNGLNLYYQTTCGNSSHCAGVFKIYNITINYYHVSDITYYEWKRIS